MPNVDLLPPKFKIKAKNPLRCGRCGSWRSHPWEWVAGKCLMSKQSRHPDQRPIIIGPQAYFRDRHLYDGPIWDCFTPIEDAEKNGTSQLHVPNATKVSFTCLKSGQNV